MKLYEGLFLTDAGLASKDWPALEKYIHDLLEKYGGKIVYSEKWADRRLAYEIKGCKKGTFYLVYFNAESDLVENVRREIQLADKVLRVQFIAEDGGLVEEMERRKNKEVEAPPMDLTVDDRGFRAGGRFRDQDGGRFGRRPPRDSDRGRNGKRDESKRDESKRDESKRDESKRDESKSAPALVGADSKGADGDKDASDGDSKDKSGGE